MDIKEVLNLEARRGETVYERFTGPLENADRFVAEVRRARGRRRAAGVGALALVTIGLAMVASTFAVREGEPADSPPGTLVWSTDIGSQSWSSPVAVTPSILAVGADDGTVRGLDVHTGEVQWSVATGGDIRGALVSRAGVVFASSEDGSLYAISDEGVVLWETAVSSPTVAHDAWQPIAAAPLIVGDMVCLGDRDAHVTCLDAATGAVKWTAQVQGRVTAQAASDGARLFVGADDARLYAFDLATGQELWVADVGGEIATPPAVASGIVVVGNRGTDVVGLSAQTGEAVWRVAMGTSWAESAPAIADGVAYFGSSLGGHVSAVNLATGELRWRTTVGGLPWARPAIAGDMVYATAPRTGAQRPWLTAIYALDRASGAIVWAAPGGPALDWRPEGEGYGAGSEPAVIDNVVVVSGLDGVIYALKR